MSEVRFKVLRVMTDGEIVLVGDNGKESHGETVYCTVEHDCSKACAKHLLDTACLLVNAAVTDEEGKELMPAIYETPRARILRWFEARAAAEAEAAEAVELPKKSVTVKEGGKTIKREVEDQDLA